VFPRDATTADNDKTGRYRHTHTRARGHGHGHDTHAHLRRAEGDHGRSVWWIYQDVSSVLVAAPGFPMARVGGFAIGGAPCPNRHRTSPCLPRGRLRASHPRHPLLRGRPGSPWGSKGNHHQYCRGVDEYRYCSCQHQHWYEWSYQYHHHHHQQQQHQHQEHGRARPLSPTHRQRPHIRPTDAGGVVIAAGFGAGHAPWWDRLWGPPRPASVPPAPGVGLGLWALAT
jgi:hypothetical protein